MRFNANMLSRISLRIFDQMTGYHHSGNLSQWNHQLSIRGGVMALLALYIAAFISSPAGVPHVHHDTGIVHSDSCLEDPCHVSIFHSGNQHPCEHKNHLSSSGVECDLCKVTMVPQELTKSNHAEPLAESISKPIIPGKMVLVVHVVNNLSNKGPPFLS